MKSCSLAFLFALLAFGGAHAEPPRRVSMLEAVDLALSHSSDLAIASEAIEGARERVSGARAQRLPRLRAEAAVSVWDKALTFSLGTMLPPGTEEPTIREQVTSTASVSLVQPLSGLLVLNKLVGVEQHGVAVARADLDTARLEIAYRVAESYLRLLQATAGRDVSQKSVAQLEAQLVRARQLETAGSLGRVDTLRIETARDAAKQAALRADAAVTIGARTLALQLELGTGVGLETFDDLPATPPAVPWTEDQAVELALRNRPELRAATERIAQARGAREIARAAYFPNINAIASYQNNQGVGTIQPENAAFVGVNLQWDVWDWGKTGAAVAEAEHRARQAELARARLGDQVSFDVRRRWVEARTAQEGLVIAATGVTAAEEAYRIQNARFEQGAATTTDLLDAETEVARARLGVIIARYDYLVALVALARAIGESPSSVK